VKRIVIFGATSAIAQALARGYAAEHARFFLIGRNAERVASVEADLAVRGAQAGATATADLTDMPQRLNDDPYGEGWLCVIHVEDAGQLDQLLDAAAYRALIDG